MGARGGMWSRAQSTESLWWGGGRRRCSRRRVCTAVSSQHRGLVGVRAVKALPICRPAGCGVGVGVGNQSKESRK